MDIRFPTSQIRILALSGLAIAHTGTTAETTLLNVTIPAGTMGLNGMLRLDFSWSATNNSNVKTSVVRFGSTGFSSVPLTSNLSGSILVRIQNRGVANSQVSNVGAHLSPYAVSTAGLLTGSVNTAIDRDLAISAILANAGDTMTLERYSVELLLP